MTSESSALLLFIKLFSTTSSLNILTCNSSIYNFFHPAFLEMCVMLWWHQVYWEVLCTWRGESVFFQFLIVLKFPFWVFKSIHMEISVRLWSKIKKLQLIQENAYYWRLTVLTNNLWLLITRTPPTIWTKGWSNTEDFIVFMEIMSFFPFPWLKSLFYSWFQDFSKNIQIFILRQIYSSLQVKFSSTLHTSIPPIFLSNFFHISPKKC